MKKHSSNTRPRRTRTFSSFIRLGILPLSACVLSVLSAADNTATFFISNAGSDKGAGTVDSPFSSLGKARDAVRELIASGHRGDVEVNLLRGIYRLDRTLVLGLEDSARPGTTITWQAYHGEDVILSSGYELDGWKRLTESIGGLPKAAKGKLWVVDLPEEIEHPLSLYQDYRMLVRARTEAFAPTATFHRTDNPVGYLDLYTLHFPEGTVRSWPNLQDAELFILPGFPWWQNILNFESVDEAKRVARTTLPGTDFLTAMVKYAKKDFPKNAWIENVPEGMTEPGCWMVNTVEGKIYYWPEDNGRPNGVFVPKLRELIRVEGVNDNWGDNDKPVRGLVFRGLNFTHADRGVWDPDDAGIQHDWEMVDKDNAMLRFRGAEDCRVERCKFYGAGGNAIRMDLYAQRISVENNLFHDLGQSAIMMMGYGPGTKDVNKYNRIYSNHIHDCGQIYLHSQMITAFQSGHNYIAHNYVHDVPRKAVCITGFRDHFLKDGERKRRECVDTVRWDEIGDAVTREELLPFLHSRHNVVEFNRVHDALEELGDGAAINLSGTGVGNIVRFNYVYDIPAPHVTSAIRMDNDQSESLIEKNVVVNVGAGGITPKGANTIRNNVVIDSCVKENKGFIRALGIYGLSTIQKNIFYSTNLERDFYTRESLNDYKTKSFVQGIDNNLYFSPSGEVKEKEDLVRFRNLGADQHSLHEDPLFVDLEGGDYRLSPDSPALDIGIESVDVSAAGLTSEYPF